MLWIVVICALPMLVEGGDNCSDLSVHYSMIPGKRINYHLIRRYTKTGVRMCVRFCEMHHDCLSVNHRDDTMVCQLSSSNALLRPDAMRSANMFDYYTVRLSQVEKSRCGNKTCNQGQSCVQLSSGRLVCVKSDLQCRKDGYNFVQLGTFCSKYYNEIRSMEEAKSVCLSDGTDLIRVNSHTRQRELAQRLADDVSSDVTHIWIQGISVPGQPFKYSNGNSMTYTKWDTGQPITGATQTLGVAMLVGSSYKWTAVDATERHPFVCGELFSQKTLF